MPQINPTFDNIVVNVISVPKETQSGIILSASASEKPSLGTVVAVGIGKRSPDGTIQKMYLNVGDRVAFNVKSGVEVVAGGTKYLMMKEDDVLAVITE